MSKSRTKKADTGFTTEERAAMKERARELKASGNRADGERDLLAKIKDMPKGDRDIAERIHALVTKAAPQLAPKTWYGMPAYALDGKVVCFFQSAEKFKSRYSTFGFSDTAQLDEGDMWPTSFALKSLGPKEERRIVELVKKALG